MSTTITCATGGCGETFEIPGTYFPGDVILCPRCLRRKVGEDTEGLEKSRRDLKALEASCQHDWSEPKYDPIIQEAYYSPGDREMGRELGIDSRPGCHVPRSETPLWRRQCRACGKVEETKYSKTKTTEKISPDFR